MNAAIRTITPIRQVSRSFSATTARAYLNKVQLIDRFCADPTVTDVGAERRVVNYTVATSETRPDQEGNLIQKTQWHHSTSWNSADWLPERVNKKVRIDLVYVEGQLRYSDYTDKEGIQRTKADIYQCCGMTTVMAPDQFGYGHVGAPVPCCEVKLVDVPDANYFSTNFPKPQGEVWVRGASVCGGYWKREDITKETITNDGWLQTGDIAEWNENGTLTIIDRKKNLVKLSNGEYIALEKLESIYKSCLFVSNLCVYADSLLAKPVALVVPIEAYVRAWASENDVAEKDWEKLCLEPSVRKAVLAAMISQCKEAGLKPAEMLFDISLCHEEWTTESGLLTAAQKLKRQDINKKFQEQLDTINKAQKN